MPAGYATEVISPDMMLYLVYFTMTILKVRHRIKEEQLVASDLSNH